MNGDHLTDEQLSARLDGVLDAADEARIDSHLASCDACAARLETFASLDGALGDALTHEPGDAYFADFADRVAARIATDPKGEAALAREAAGVAGSGASTDGPAALDAPAAKRRGLWERLLSPRALTLAGSAAVIAVAVGLGAQWFAQRGQLANVMSQQVAKESAPATRAAVPTSPSGGEPVTSMSSAADSSASVPQATNAPAKDAAGTAPAHPAVAMQTTPGTTPLSARADRAPSLMRSVPREAERKVIATPAPAPAVSMQSTRQEAVAADAAPQANAIAERTPPAATAAPAPVAAKQKLTDALAQSLRAASPLQKSLADAPGAAPATPPEKSRLKLGFGGASALSGTSAGPSSDPRCGTVHDTRGAPLPMTQVRLSGTPSTSTRTAPDGRFCLERAPQTGDTLTVMHVGFEPMRIVVRDASSLAVAMEPVGILGENGGMLTSGNAAPEPDVYAAQSAEVRADVAAARAQAALAARDRSAEAYEQLVVLWDDVAVRTTGAAGYDARFRSLAALRDALAIAPEPARRERLRHALEEFIAATPRRLPERGTALRWQQELVPR